MAELSLKQKAILVLLGSGKNQPDSIEEQLRKTAKVAEDYFNFLSIL